jgi:pimeloyl-ACP methyl ester carboxylesterase
MNSTKEALSDKFNNEYLGDIAETDSDKIEQIILQYYRSSHEGGIFAKHAYASHLAQYMTVNVLHELQEDEHPILIIGGEYEPEIEANIENYSFYKKDLKSVIIAGSAHLPQLDNAEETAEHIISFIKQ